MTTFTGIRWRYLTGLMSHCQTSWAELTANSSESEIKQRYISTKDHTLTIHIHASPSYYFYGFIAEIVTVPLSALTYPGEYGLEI